MSTKKKLHIMRWDSPEKSKIYMNMLNNATEVNISICDAKEKDFQKVKARLYFDKDTLGDLIESLQYIYDRMEISNVILRD